MMKIIFNLLIALMFIATTSVDAADSIHVLVWDEQQPQQKAGYDGKFLGETIADHLQKQNGLSVKTAKLDDVDQGLNDAAIDAADVLIFWCHRRVKDQDDKRMEAVVKRVMDGKLGFIGLHSTHWGKPFVRLMQERAKTDAAKQLPLPERATANWVFLNESPFYNSVGRAARVTPFVEKGEGNTWKLTLPACVFPVYRNDAMPSHVTTLLPQHPIAAGLPAHWDIPRTEMYGEPFHVPPPDEIVFEEKWDKGEHFRSGCVWQVGKGHVFYFRPGHETYPVFEQAEPLRVLENAVRWLALMK